MKVKLSQLGRKVSEEKRQHLKKINEEQWKNPARHEKSSEYLKARWRDPVYREKMQNMSRKMMTAEHKSRLSSTLKEVYASSDVKARLSEKSKSMWQQPGFREKMLAAQKAGRERKARLV